MEAQSPHGLIYLSHPFGGDAENLQRAVRWLAWAHEFTKWGLNVQAPWIPSAMAQLERGLTEEQWEREDGHRIERRTLDGYSAVLSVGRATLAEYSSGMRREARYMAAYGRAWGVPRATVPDGHEYVEDTTAAWRSCLRPAFRRTWTMETI